MTRASAVHRLLNLRDDDSKMCFSFFRGGGRGEIHNEKEEEEKFVHYCVSCYARDARRKEAHVMAFEGNGVLYLFYFVFLLNVLGELLSVAFPPVDVYISRHSIPFRPFHLVILSMLLENSE